MNSNRNTARIVGILFIIGTIAGSSSFVGAPSLDDPDYIIDISTNGNLTIIGAIRVLVMGIALAPVPVFARAASIPNLSTRNKRDNRSSQ
jgi:hypothetical protein